MPPGTKKVNSNIGHHKCKVLFTNLNATTARKFSSRHSVTKELLSL